MSDKQPRILIVEDDLDLSEMLDAYFRVQNYDVVTAAWGRDALKISREEDLSLIMLDIRLPDINGYEICRQLRLQRKTQDTPIIFLTEKRDRIDKLQGLELGVVDYITKPFDIQELRLRVRNAINRARQAGMINPVTELPEVQVLDERLNRLLYSDAHWAVMVLEITGMGTLREMYGFVAADEMLRAVTLMIKNALREFGNEDDLLAHLTPEDLAIVTTTDKIEQIRSRIETRIRLSLTNFYRRPHEEGDQDDDYLSLTSGVVDYQSGKYDELDELKAALMAILKPDEPPKKE
ncbi:MAG: response regulator [Anaerolinea sp.]|nr:response regulator [Anaerolinea sp.]